MGNILDVGLGLPVGTFGIRISECRISFDWESFGEIFLCFMLLFEMFIIIILYSI